MDVLVPLSAARFEFVSPFNQVATIHRSEGSMGGEHSIFLEGPPRDCWLRFRSWPGVDLGNFHLTRLLSQTTGILALLPLIIDTPL